MEFVSPEGLRLDGRRPTELRRISCQIDVLQNADGSAIFEMGNTKVCQSAVDGLVAAAAGLVGRAACSDGRCRRPLVVATAFDVLLGSGACGVHTQSTLPQLPAPGCHATPFLRWRPTYRAAACCACARCGRGCRCWRQCGVPTRCPTGHRCRTTGPS